MRVLTRAVNKPSKIARRRVRIAPRPLKEQVGQVAVASRERLRDTIGRIGKKNKIAPCGHHPCDCPVSDTSMMCGPEPLRAASHGES